MEAVKFDNVQFRYSDEENSFALKDINLSVEEGEFLAVLGHNGSGKSTLSRLINGLLTADEGKVEVFGKDASLAENLYEVRKNAGIVFQNPDNQMVASIVEDDVAFGPENIGVPREEIGERITYALNAVGMSSFRNATPARLSGGQKQRIAIAGVLAIKPKIIIMDESTAMLDPRGRKEVMDVVQKLNKEEGLTVIIITHFMEEALLADRAVVMSKGRIVAQGKPEDIFSDKENIEKYELTLPTVAYIAEKLREGGMDIPMALYPEQLAEEIKRCVSK